MTAEKKKMIIEYGIFAAGGFAIGVGIFFLFNMMGSSQTVPGPIPAPAAPASNDSGGGTVGTYQVKVPYSSPAKPHTTKVPGTNVSLPAHTAVSFSKGDIVDGGGNFMYKGVAYIIIEKKGSGTGPVAVPLSILTKTSPDNQARFGASAYTTNSTGGAGVVTNQYSNITGPPAGNVIWTKDYWPVTGLRLRLERGGDWSKPRKPYF